MKNKLLLLSALTLCMGAFSAVSGIDVIDNLDQAFSTVAYADGNYDEASGLAYKIDNEGNIYITDGPGIGKDVVIPEQIDGIPVTGIGASAFTWKKNIETVVIPGTVTYIGGNAFNNCTNLKSVTINGDAQYDEDIGIGAGAFASCSSLVSINLPQKLPKLGENAFNGCAALQSITIPPTLTTIENSTFSGCRSLTSIDLPESITTLKSSAFNACSSVTSISIPGTIKSLGSNVFNACTSVKEVYFGFNATDYDYDPLSELFQEGIAIYYAEGKKGWASDRPQWLSEQIKWGKYLEPQVRKADSSRQVGDIDANDAVNSADVAQLLKKISNPAYKTPIENELPDNYSKFIDYNGDGKIDLSDAIKMMKEKNIN